MAELVLKIGDKGSTLDGDLTRAYNNRRIHLVHAHHICWPRINGIKISGFVGGTQPLLEKMYNRTAQYKWERISKSMVERTNLWTLAKVVYGSTPIEDPDRPGFDEHGIPLHAIHCHVDRHFDWRMLSPLVSSKPSKMPMFGSVKNPVEYGGRTKQDASTVELIWDDIEAGSDKRRANYNLHPTGTKDLFDMLWLSVDNFSDEESARLVEPDVEVTGQDAKGLDIAVTHHKFKRKINWRALPQLARATSIAKVNDKKVAVDVREAFTLVRKDVVAVKARA